MNFVSDNTAPAAPEILAALSAVNDERAPAYGEDRWSKQLDETFSTLFERDVRVFTVASGTAANAISTASLAPPWGAVLCHREAHIECDECGAAEFYSGGAKLVLLDGAAAKITPAALEEGSRGMPAISTLCALSALDLADDGARRCVSARGNRSAGRHRQASWIGPAHGWRAVRQRGRGAGMQAGGYYLACGRGFLSFGATKNGALAAEAIVCFDPARAEEIARRRKRGGHLFSKGRYRGGAIAGVSSRTGSG